MTSIIYTTADPCVIETFNHLVTIHASFGIVNREKALIPLLTREEDEKLVQVGQRLYIQTPYARLTASKRMQTMLNLDKEIRWANHLWFSVPDYTLPINFKNYVEIRHPSKRWAS
jgi:hypothetical protein